MTKTCFCFEVHQPYRLNMGFNFENARRKRNLEELYFSEKNREILKKVAENCYIPATQIVLDSLDNGFKCAFSLSGVAVEQLERGGKDAFELFKQVAQHKNSEVLAQTYYHSLAGLFSYKDELEEQIKLHVKLMDDVFSAKPAVFENTELIFNSSIAEVAKKLNFKAIYAEGVEKVLGWRGPDYVYSCNGIKVLMRNYRLSDDIAFRFSSSDWGQHPLTADKFAKWLKATPGDCISIFIDYETFGEHHWKESGILEFLRWLPLKGVEEGVEFAKPSEAAELDARGEISVDDTTSWADIEKDVSAWLGNDMQRTAFRAVERCRVYAEHYRKDIWRYLQISDHFYYMATKQGSSGEVHAYFSQQGPFETFSAYMSLLSHYEEKCASKMKSKKAGMVLRSLPPEKAFHFFKHSEYCCSAHSLDELAELLKSVQEESIIFHIERGDFSRWIADVIGDKELAKEVARCKDRDELVELVERRKEELWNLLR